MTIALCLKVSDGLVFGADSAATTFDRQGERVYTNAEKIVNLHKCLPVGLVTYGLGGLGGRSVTNLAKDLRSFFMHETDGRRDFHLDPSKYTVEEIAGRVREYFYEELYQDHIIPAVEALKEQAEEEEGADPDRINFPAMGFVVAGISAGQSKTEVWSVVISRDGECAGPDLLWDTDADGVIVYRGYEEPLDRLLMGTTPDAGYAVMEEGLTQEEARDLLVRWAPLAHGAMPIQDAIDLVEYLAEVAAGYIRFSAGPNVVAPPIDIAAITPHEKFKWVSRKHYYPPELNP